MSEFIGYQDYTHPYSGYHTNTIGYSGLHLYISGFLNTITIHTTDAKNVVPGTLPEKMLFYLSYISFYQPCKRCIFSTQNIMRLNHFTYYFYVILVILHLQLHNSLHKKYNSYLEKWHKYRNTTKYMSLQQASGESHCKKCLTLPLLEFGH